MIRAVSSGARAITVATLVLGVVACGHMPWSARTAEAPRAVQELQEFAEDGTAIHAFPQFWKRNTLVVDLQAAASSGKVILKPRDNRQWPVRMAFRVTPGTLGLLEVQADQRMLIPITSEGTGPVDIELVPSVYTPKTPQMHGAVGR